MFFVTYIERHTSSCQQDSVGIDNEINESAVVDYAAAVSSSGSCGPSDANQGDIVEDVNEQEFIPESDNNDDDEGLTDGLSDEVFDDMFQEAFFAYDDDDTVDKKANKKLLRWLCLFISLQQKKFNVTDSAVEFLLKFLMLLFKV